MSEGIPYKFKVDFSGYDRDMVAKASSRMLSQFWASPVMKDFVAAFIRNGPEWAYREIIRQQEANSLYMAEGENLDAIGRIVGQPRVPYLYDDSKWFTPDRAGQGFDQAPLWVQNAPMTGNEPATDTEYRMMILARIVCNFNRFSSAPEMRYLVEFATGEKVAWRRTGPCECQIMVSGDISRSNLDILTRMGTDTRCDDIFAVPYPATMSLSGVLFLPDNPFIFDREDGHQFDSGLYAVGRTFD